MEADLRKSELPEVMQDVAAKQDSLLSSSMDMIDIIDNILEELANEIASEDEVDKSHEVHSSILY